MRWEDAKVHVLTHTLHYGSGAFEGIRAYQTPKGTAVLRLKEHMDRLIYSSRALAMELKYSSADLCKATLELLSKNKLAHGYIRPLVYHGYGVMGLRTKDAPVDTAISCWEWGAYLPHDSVDVKISRFVRLHPRSTVVDAKLCGHYVNSIMAANELRGTEFHEALLLDANGNVAEGPGENIFLVQQGALHTPKLGTILAGITRDTVIQIAKSKNIKVIERDIKPEELFRSAEAFFTGTAAEVTPIRSIDKHLIGNGAVGPITNVIKSAFGDIVSANCAQFEHFLSFV